MQVKHETFEDYRDRLKKRKIKKLGDGLYSFVYQHPTHKNVVVKVTAGDDAYLTYARFAQANPQNPYLPKVLDIVPVTLLCAWHPINPEYHENPYVAFLEKLDPIEFYNTEHDALVDDLCEIAEDEEFDHGMSNREFWKRVLHNTDCPHLLQLADFIVDNHKLGLDLHDENYMVRTNPNGRLQLVITDPFSSCSSDSDDDEFF